MGPVPRRDPHLTEDDLWLHNEGRHTRLYEVLGCHLLDDGSAVFGVWAPNARAVSVVGDFNHWRDGTYLEQVGDSGLWQGDVAEVAPGSVYKFHIESAEHGYQVDKADPFAFAAEVPPRTASVACRLDHRWSDDDWMATRGHRNARHAPLSVYELHLGSWRHAAGEHRSLHYRELADPLVRHVTAHGFTHVELLPVMEHPYYPSWGYQTTGYFAPTARFGPPEDFMALIDALHRAGIGVILDWVPSHFPDDQHGLAFFDGTHLFEHADPRQGRHPDWDSLIFNYDRHEVRSFLLSSAHFWLDRYHADGLRVDAVASMLYLDYSREEGAWIPNEHGGNENLGALRFLKALNETVYERFGDCQTIAEESTAWPLVSRPTSVGGLGFGFKWDMGWMHDTLEYLGRDPIFRRHHQGELTFRMIYAFGENYVLPLSHDEVVHGKGSLLARMPGDRWQQLANLRLLFGYQWTLPGKKLLFMGGEFAQPREWNHDTELDWGVLDGPEGAGHRGVSAWVSRLNELLRSEPALHAIDGDPEGFEWIDTADARNSVLAYQRLAPDPADRAGSAGAPSGRPVVVVANFTPVPHSRYRVGVPVAGEWEELATSDAVAFGGTGWGNPGVLAASDEPWHGRPASLEISLPPLGVLILAPRQAPGADPGGPGEGRV